jgi:hypothetical protein
MIAEEMTPDEVERATQSHLCDIRIAITRSASVRAEIERGLRLIVDSVSVRGVLEAEMKKV